MDAQPTYDPPVDSSTTSGHSTGVAAGSPASPEQLPTPGAQTPVGATPGSPAAPARPTGDWIPRSRLNEVADRYRALERENLRLRAAAAHPAAPTPPANAADEEIKAAFFRLFPAARSLFALPSDQLTQLLDQAPQQSAQLQHYWTTVGHGALRAIDAAVEKTYGGAPDARARRWLQAAFIDWLESDETARQRYLSQDPTLANDFWRDYESLLLDPVRRAASAAELSRAAKRNGLPVPGPRTQTLGQGAPPKPKTEDEIHEQAWAALSERR